MSARTKSTAPSLAKDNGFMSTMVEDPNNPGMPLFRFLSARQVLNLEGLLPRQILSETPQPRNPFALDALSYLFISHRWETPERPDASGAQLKTLQGVLLLLEDMFQATITRELQHNWPENVEDMTEGMPQAASIASRAIKKLAGSSDQLLVESMCQNPLDHIFVWYDCACLPQNHPAPRLAHESVEMKEVLKNLDLLARQCDMLILRSATDDYFSRAWCSFEHLQKSLVVYEGDVSIVCEKFIEKEKFDWCLEPDIETQSPKKRLPPLPPAMAKTIAALPQNQRALILAKFLQVQMKQQRTQDMVRKTFIDTQKTTLGTAKAGWLGFPKAGAKTIPDLCQTMYAIRRSNHHQSTPPAPMKQAMASMIQELHAAVFAMSCRDAGLGVQAPANCNQCLPDVGIQCGLHSDAEWKQKERAEKFEALLSAPVQSGSKSDGDGCHKAISCPNGHCLRPSIAHNNPRRCDAKECSQKQVIQKGQVHTSCSMCDYDLCMKCSLPCASENKNPSADPTEDAWKAACEACNVTPVAAEESPAGDDDICERKVTVDLYELAKSCLEEHGQRCTNEKDLGFVGLLALRNLLQEGQSDKNAKSLRFSVGALFHLREMAEVAVERFASALALQKEVGSLTTTITIRAPRWVLFDMLNSRSQAHNATANDLIAGTALSLGENVERYLTENPMCISFGFDETRSSATLLRTKCSECNAVWGPCQHRTQKQFLRLAGSTLKVNSTLDPWSATLPLPTPIVASVSLATEDRVYVVSGATGEEDVAQNAYTTCTKDIYVAYLPLSHTSSWSAAMQLNEARRNHAACLYGSSHIIVSGGKGTTVAGKDAASLSSIEIVNLADNIVTQGPIMPIHRTGHHMIALGTKLFIFGGTSRKGTPGVAQCDIYDFEQSMWKEGPRLPVAFRGGSSVLVRERYAVVFGGIGQGEKQLKQSWVLDLKPWLEAGSDTAEAPASSWFRGPDLPMELGDPMICYVSDAASGRPESWILAAGPSLLGNFCVGLKITADADLTQAKFWRSLRWLSMGATPDSYILTGCVASKGSLMIVGGYSCSENTATDKVWFREFSQQPGLLLPAAPSSGGDLKEKSELLELQRMVLNDHFPIGRLGLPLSEEQLFSSDAVKKLTLLPPGLCDMCLDSGRSVEASRTDTARFCIQKDKMSRRFSMCSRCFCAATEVSTQETTETVNVLEHAMSTPNEEEKDAGNTSIVGEGGEEKKEESTEEEKLTEDLKAVLLEDFHRSLEEEGIVVDGKNVETLFDGVFGEEKGEKNNRRESTRNEPGQVFRNIVWRGQQGKLRLTSDGFSFKPKGSACYSWQWSSVQKCLMAAKQSNQTQLKLSCKHSTRKSVIFSLRTREDLEALHKVAKNYMREAQSKGGTMHADESERTASTTDTTGRDVSESWL